MGRSGYEPWDRGIWAKSVSAGFQLIIIIPPVYTALRLFHSEPYDVCHPT